MSILRVKRQRSYTSIPNAALHDLTLSYRARGILAFMLAHPDDWEVTTGDLATKGVEGRDAIRTALAELREAGYIEQFKETYQGEDGKQLWRTVTVITDTPAEDKYTSPRPENPVPETAPSEDGFSGASVLTTSNKLSSNKETTFPSFPTRRGRVKRSRPEPEDDPQSLALAQLEDSPPEREVKPTLEDPLLERKHKPKSVAPAERLAEVFRVRALAVGHSVPGETNLKALAGTFRRWMKDGHSYQLILDMIETYWSPSVQRKEDTAWKDFLARRGELVTRCKKAADVVDVEANRHDPSAWTW